MKQRFLFAAVLFGLGVNAAYAIDNKGLLMYLRFDEGSGTVARDVSGNKNHGELTGKVDWVDGKFGKAIRTDDGAAANMVVVKHSDSFNVPQMTLVAWANIEAMPDSNAAIIGKADTWMIHTSNWRGPAIEWEPLFWTPGFVAWQTAASVNVPLKEWHHIAGVFDGKQVTTYIDGKERGKVAQAGSIGATKADVAIGRDNRGCCATRKAKQSIDEVMIWSRPLSADEVAEVVAGKVVAVEPKGKAATAWAILKAF